MSIPLFFTSLWLFKDLNWESGRVLKLLTLFPARKNILKDCFKPNFATCWNNSELLTKL